MINTLQIKKDNVKTIKYIDKIEFYTYIVFGHQ